MEYRFFSVFLTLSIKNSEEIHSFIIKDSEEIHSFIERY
jgi:hypothetical protein